MGAGNRQVALGADYRPRERFAGDADRRAVIAGEYQVGAVRDAEGVHGGNQVADQAVQVLDVRAEMLGRVHLVGYRAVRGQGRRNPGGVRQRGWEVGQERNAFLAGLTHEVDQPGGIHVGTVVVGPRRQQAAVALHLRIPVARSLPRGEHMVQLPQRVDIEAVVVPDDGGGDVRRSPPGVVFDGAERLGHGELPFARHRRAVARGAKHLREGGLVGIEPTERFVVSVVVSAGHELHAGRRAQRLAEGACECAAPGGERRDMGCSVGRAAVGLERLDAGVIGEYQHDVGPGRFTTAVVGLRQSNRAPQKCVQHQQRRSKCGYPQHDDIVRCMSARYSSGFTPTRPSRLCAQLSRCFCSSRSSSKDAA